MLASTRDVWPVEAVTSSVFYYEVVDCQRRLGLADVVVLINPNTADQIAASLLVAFVFVVVPEAPHSP